MKADLHAHTHHSGDSVTKPEALIKKAKERGLDALAVTDHSSIRGWKEALDLGKRYGVLIILGEEAKAVRNGKFVGDIIALFINGLIRPGAPEEVLDAIKSQGAIAILPHPFDGGRRYREMSKEVVEKVHGMETLNAHASAEANRLAKGFANHHNLAQIGSSDAHAAFEVGRAWTEFKGDTLEDLRKAIIRRQTEAKGKESSKAVRSISTMAKMKKVAGF